MRTSKISHLPRALRDQLNRRIENGEKSKNILAWLNSLPEVQALITAQFEGIPVTQQNFSDWKASGYRDWQLRQSALQFAAHFELDDSGLQQSLTDTLTQKLAYWVTLRYAAAAQTLTAAADDTDPQTQLRQLRDFCQDIVMLRRGDLSAGRLDLAHQRLDFEKASADHDQEAEFWEWTKRPDIQAKLYPYRDPDKIRRDVERMLNHRLLGIPDNSALPHDPDPATLI